MDLSLGATLPAVLPMPDREQEPTGHNTDEDNSDPDNFETRETFFCPTCGMRLSRKFYQYTGCSVCFPDLREMEGLTGRLRTPEPETEWVPTVASTWVGRCCGPPRVAARFHACCGGMFTALWWRSLL